MSFRALVPALVAVLLVSCGGDTSQPATDPGVTAEDQSTGADDAVGGGGGGDAAGGCPVDECDDGLLPALDGIPVPDTVQAYAFGQEASERIDGSIAQQAFLSGSIADAAGFYDEALDDVEVTFRYQDEDEYAVDWVDPQGRSVSISVRRGQIHPVLMDIVVAGE